IILNCSIEMSYIPLGPNWVTRAMPPGASWYNSGEQRILFGCWSLISGIIAEVLYFPCMLALLAESKNSCYKIMFWISLVDMLTLLVCSVFYGLGLLHGDVYCSNPLWHFCLGAYGIGCWTASCLGCLTLVSNRLAELMDIGWIFTGRRTYVFLVVSTLYGFAFALFTPPPLFNSKYQSFFFNPYIDESEKYTYRNIPHAINNLTVVILSTIFYVILCGIIGMKQVSSTGAMSTDLGRKRIRASRAVFLQAAVICFGNFTSSIMYVYFNFFYTPPALIIFAQVAWQLGLSLQPIIYLLVNSKIRAYYLNMLGANRFMRKSMSASVVPLRNDSRR
ncbi:hypothetical protein PMAYCL1PPCAC_17375, partial [Pristionchus mayeri]